MHAPYRVVTERLVLRCWAPRDAPALKAAIDESLEHLRGFMPWAYDEPTEVPDMVERLQGFRADFDRGEGFIYGILDRACEVAGGAGLHQRVGDGALEIGYWIHVARTRRGLATEAVSALTRVAFDACGAERVEIHVDPRNAPSLAVARRRGDLEEATLRQRLPPCPPGTPRGDVTIFSLLDAEYRASPLAAFPVEAYDGLGARAL